MRYLVTGLLAFLLAVPAQPMGRDLERYICDGTPDRPGRLYRVVVPDYVTVIELLENGCLYAVLDANGVPVPGNSPVRKYGGYVGTRQTRELKKYGKALND